MPIVAVVNRSRLDDADVAFFAAGVDAQLREDFVPAWEGVDYTPVTFFASTDNLPVASGVARLMVIQDTIDQPGASGYHDFEGVPRSVILAQGQQTSVTMSHEACEMTADPNADKWVRLPDGSDVALEVCLSGDTPIRLASGVAVPIADLAGAVDLAVTGVKDGNAVRATAWNIRRTARTAPVLALKTSEGSFRCTQEHRVLMSDGSYREARFIRPGDRLFHVGPRSPETDARDSRLVHPEPERENDKCFSGSTNLPDSFLRQLGDPDGLATQVAVAQHAPLSRGVHDVLVVGADKQVRGVRADRVVAAMAHFGAVRDRSDVHLVRQPMDVVVPLFKPQLSVASAGCRPRPAPASRRPDDSTSVSLGRGSRGAGVLPRPSGVYRPMFVLPPPVRRAKTLGPVGSRTSFDGAQSHHAVVYSVESGGNSDVYDLTVPATSNVTLGNGLVVHNCDPCESDSYAKLVTIMGADRYVTVSNFVLPSWFQPAGRGPFDRMGTIAQALELAPGGYEIVQGADGKVSDVWASDAARMARRLAKVANSTTRSYRRGLRL